MYVSAADDFVLLDNRFEGNEAGGSGGGAAVHACNRAEVTDNVFAGNEASAVDRSFEGGGLAIYRNACRDVLERAAAPRPST